MKVIPHLCPICGGDVVAHCESANCPWVWCAREKCVYNVRPDGMITAMAHPGPHRSIPPGRGEFLG